VDQDKREVRYRIEGMDCANCALTLERGLAQIHGIDQVRVNFTTTLLEASGNFTTEELVERVRILGYRAVDERSAESSDKIGKVSEGSIGFLSYLLSESKTRIALVGAVLLLLSLPLSFSTISVASVFRFVLHIAVVFLAGLPIAIKGVRSLIFARQVTIDLLMSIATLGAVFIGETGEAATVIVLFTVGEALEGYAAEKARRSLRSLLALKPERAIVLRPCMDCTEHLGREGYTGGPCPFCGTHEIGLPVENVVLKDMVLVRPGERIPIDGLIIDGTSSINQSSVTGESVPVVKGPGENVFAGTLNGEAALEIEVTHLVQDSTISRIVKLVEEAQSRRAPIERFVDRFATWYTPVVVLIALLVAVVPPLFFNAPFLNQPDGTRGWLYRALAMLIVACPCALVISTPVSLVSALTSLARQGVLVKGGRFLDALARARIFAFDKTGTLTLGKPKVIQVQTMDCSTSDKEGCIACDDMLALAAAVESRSEHPLAQAILDESHHRQLEHRYPPAREVIALAGRGVQGQVNGDLITVSSHDHSHENFEEQDSLHYEIEQAEANGQTVMLISKNNRVLGFVCVADVNRPSSQAALQDLKSLDSGSKVVMLTGDHRLVAEKLADSLGFVDEVYAGLMPADKVGVVRKLQEKYGAVVMIGDGVNDAPALAAASVGIAMGGAGTAQAMETADIVLMQDDLTHLATAVITSRRTQTIIKQNIIFSLVVKGIFLLLTIPGWATLWMAVFADMGASLLVTMNGMRLLASSRNHKE